MESVTEDCGNGSGSSGCVLRQGCYRFVAGDRSPQECCYLGVGLQGRQSARPRSGSVRDGRAVAAVSCRLGCHVGYGVGGGWR